MKVYKAIFLRFLSVTFTFAIVGVLSVTGCVKKNGIESVEKPDSVIEAGLLQKDYAEVGIDRLPSGAVETFQSLRRERGYLVFISTVINDDQVLLMILSGEKMTGGYGVSVEGFAENNGELVILIKEIKPGPDSMVTQAITYPYTVIELEDTHETYRVKTIDNEYFSNLEGSEPLRR